MSVPGICVSALIAIPCSPLPCSVPWQLGGVDSCWLPFSTGFYLYLAKKEEALEGDGRWAGGRSQGISPPHSLLPVASLAGAASPAQVPPL